MKFEKPKSGEIGAGVAQVAGATLGFLAPNGIANAVAKVDNEAVITDDQKKTKMYVNVACTISGIALALMVKGSDMGANAVRGAGFGLAGGGAKGLITHFAGNKVATVQDTTTRRLIAGALNCPCEAQQPTYRALQMPRSLRMSVSEAEIVTNADPLG